MPRITTRTALLILALVLAVGGASVLGYAISHQYPAPPMSADIPDSSAPTAESPLTTASPQPSSTQRPSTRTPTAPSGPTPLGESVPTAIDIPAIKVNADVIDVGLKANGEIDTPDANPDQAGWFDGGHTPGADGTAIIVGHVTWNRAPTVFFKLDDLKRGDIVTVTRKDHSRATFQVRRRSTFPKDEWPADQIFAPAKSAGLTLITCGGRYDYSTHTYGSNVIVWTTLVGTKKA